MQLKEAPFFTCQVGLVLFLRFGSVTLRSPDDQKGQEQTRQVPSTLTTSLNPGHHSVNVCHRLHGKVHKTVWMNLCRSFVTARKQNLHSTGIGLWIIFTITVNSIFEAHAGNAITGTLNPANPFNHTGSFPPQR